MMEEEKYLETEREQLSRYVKSQTKYGTTVSTTKCGGNVPLVEKATRHIKHVVAPGDTLMGIALKYHVTVEQVKRLNKLWTNDSLFLREHILVPLLPSNKDLVPQSLIVQVSDYVSSTEEEEEKGDITQTPKSENGMDFLNKYDTNIAQLKSNMKALEKKSGANSSSGNRHQENSATYRQNLGSLYQLPVDNDTEC